MTAQGTGRRVQGAGHRAKGTRKRAQGKGRRAEGREKYKMVYRVSGVVSRASKVFSVKNDTSKYEDYREK